jgi:hypothetical protein
MVRFCLTLGLLVTLVTITDRAMADTMPPINLNFPASDGMSVADLLRAVSMQTGAIILPDSSVIGATGDVHITKSSVPEILDYLKTFEPGLAWQIVYYPGIQNEPAGEDLYKAIETLSTLNIDGLVLPPTGDQKLMLIYRKQLYTAPDQEKQAEAGLTPYYLVSDPVVRAQMAKASLPLPAPPAGDKASHFLSTLSELQGQFAQLSPQQQAVAVGQLAATSHVILQTISPQAATRPRSSKPPLPVTAGEALPTQ